MMNESLYAERALHAGARGYVMKEFSLLGSDVLVMFPGKSETTGGMPPVMGTSQRDITLDDATQLKQRIAAIKDIAPMVTYLLSDQVC